MEFDFFTLSNGLRVVHKQIDNSDVSHCGLLIDVGSRDEKDDEQGLAHFIEHCIFKGTGKRKAYHILSGLDAVGGELDAYTTKEETCIYASFLNKHYERAMELIADITFNSTFPAKEIEKEKEVIIDEIYSYQDSPAEQIFDDFEDMIFAGHPIGRNILGTVSSVNTLQQSHIKQFIKRTYSIDKMVFSSVGNIPLKTLQRLLEKHLSLPFTQKASNGRKPFTGYRPIERTVERDTYQTHCLMGTVAYKASDPKRRYLSLLNNILGGPAMNNRLSLTIREKFGFAYNIESSYTTYSDSGNFNIYFGTDHKHVNKTRALVLKELKKLRETPLGTRQLHQAKQQLIGQIALAQENKVNSMLAFGKSLLLYDTVDPLPVVYGKIEAITATHLLDVANEILTEDRLSTLTYLSK